MGAQAELLLGRNAELAQVRVFLEGESPAALVLEGEAGIGKTRVWEESVRMATASGYRVLATRASGSEVQLSFAALGDLLDGVVELALPALRRPRPLPLKHIRRISLFRGIETLGAMTEDDRNVPGGGGGGKGRNAALWGRSG